MSTERQRRRPLLPGLPAEQHHIGNLLEADFERCGMTRSPPFVVIPHRRSQPCSNPATSTTPQHLCPLPAGFLPQLPVVISLRFYPGSWIPVSLLFPVSVLWLQQGFFSVFFLTSPAGGFLALSFTPLFAPRLWKTPLLHRQKAIAKNASKSPGNAFSLPCLGTYETRSPPANVSLAR